MVDERKMLLALLGDERLTDTERTAFEDMSSSLTLRPSAKLTPKQFAWVDRRFQELELDVGSQNLYSSGLVPEGRTHGVKPVVFPWQDGRMAKPLRPPRPPKKDDDDA